MTYRIGDHADLITLSGEGQPSAESLRDDRTPEEKSRAGISFLLRFAGYLISIITVALIILTGVAFGRIHYELSSWPRAQADVTNCQIYTVTAINQRRQRYESLTYGFHCNLTYSAASNAYQSQADIGYRQSDNSDMLLWSARIHSGNRVPIAYDPSDPTRVRFAGDFSTAYAGPLHNLVLLKWLLAASIILIVMGRKLRPAVT